VATELERALQGPKHVGLTGVEREDHNGLNIGRHLDYLAGVQIERHVPQVTLAVAPRLLVADDQQYGGPRGGQVLDPVTVGGDAHGEKAEVRRWSATCIPCGDSLSPTTKTASGRG
jgi:hypothetical protein